MNLNSTKKNLCLFFALTLLAGTISAQSSLTYDFRNDLVEAGGMAPDLNVLGTGAYLNESLPDLSCMNRAVYSYTQNSGVQFDNGAAGNFISTSYTIEFYFKLLNNSGFIRLIDFKNRTDDNGLYVTSTEFSFYPSLITNTSAFVPNQYIHVALTRNGNTQNVGMYLDGVLAGTFVDTLGNALLNNSNVMNFFQDDLIFGNEAQPGNIALLKIYNYALDDIQVAGSYNTLKNTAGALAFTADTYATCFNGNVFNFTNVSQPSGALTYSWNFGDGFTGMGATVAHSYLTSGIFPVYLIGDDGLGCIDSISSNVEAFTIIPVALGPDFGICDGDFALLDAGAGFASYLWDDGSTNQTFITSVLGPHSVTVTDASGCSGSDTISIFQNPSPVLNLGADTVFCFGQSIILSAPLGLETYLWNTGATTESIVVSNSGTFIVEVSNLDGCISVDTIVATENPDIILSLGNDTTICDGQVLTLDAGPGFQSYLWNNFATTQTVDALADGQYIVTVTDSIGCTKTDDINVIINPVPVVDIGPDVTICGGTMLTLDAGPGFLSYFWNDGTTTQTLDIFAGGTYQVTVSDGSGCDGFDEIIVTADPFVTLGNDVQVCLGDSVLLDPGPGYSSYLWNTGSSAQSVWISTPGIYTVTVTDINGCINLDELEFTNIPAPVPSLGTSVEICTGATVTLDAGAGYSSYLWNDGSSLQTLDIFTIGSYTVTVTDSTGCTGSATVTATVGQPPVVDLGPDYNFCNGTATVLDPGSGGTAYLWNDGSTSQLFLAFAAGTYTVTVTNAAGCTATDTITLGVLNSPVVTLGADTIICDGDSIQLDAGAGFSSYLWSDGSSMQTYYATTQGVHTVTVTDANGCSGIDDIQVDFYLPVSVPTVTQNGNTLQSSAATGNQWYSATGGLIPGATGQTYNPPADGIYYVVVTDVNGCMSLPSADFNFVMSGIQHNGSLSFNVYPNPSSGMINIVTAGISSGKVIIRIFDLAGKEVYSENSEYKQTLSIDLLNLESGIYTISLTSENGNGVARIVISQ